MGVLDFIYGSSAPADEPAAGLKDSETKVSEDVKADTSAPVTDMPSAEPSELASSNVDAPEPSSFNPTDAHATESTPPTSAPTSDSNHRDDKVPVKRTPTRGFSFRSLAFMSSRVDVKPSLSTVQEHKKEGKASAALARQHVKVSRSDKRAKQEALIVRSLIIGPSSITPASATPKAVSKTSMKKVKSKLMAPKSANKLIAQLRALPGADAKDGMEVSSRAAGPIHAVCLDATDAETDTRHFSQLTTEDDATEEAAASNAIPSVVTASVEKLSSLFKDIRIISLVTSPDLGIGQPGDGEGLLSGAVPTAETVIDGVEKLTPQLMALGFATGKSIYPDHIGVYPPTDRISVLTYWWGLELCLPDNSMHYLSSAQSISHTMINFLTAMSAMNGGVREILPFVRYIGQFVDFEFNTIKSQNQGQGVVCAATWIMPAAMVPRPWDFASPPLPPAGTDPATEPTVPAPSTGIPQSPAEPEVVPPSSAPRPSVSQTLDSRPSDVTSATSHLSPVPSLPPVLPEVVVSSPNGTSNGITL